MSMAALLFAVQRVPNVAPDLSAYERLTLIQLADYYDDQKDAAWPSVDFLARLVNISVRTLRRALEGLEAANVVQRTAMYRDDGSQTSNRYTLIGFAAWRQQSGLGEHGRIPPAPPGKLTPPPSTSDTLPPSTSGSPPLAPVAALDPTYVILETSTTNSYELVGAAPQKKAESIAATQSKPVAGSKRPVKPDKGEQQRQTNAAVSHLRKTYHDHFARRPQAGADGWLGNDLRTQLAAYVESDIAGTMAAIGAAHPDAKATGYALLTRDLGSLIYDWCESGRPVCFAGHAPLIATNERNGHATFIDKLNGASGALGPNRTDADTERVWGPTKRFLEERKQRKAADAAIDGSTDPVHLRRFGLVSGG